MGYIIIKRTIGRIAILFSFSAILIHAQGRYSTNWDDYSPLKSRQKVFPAALAGQTWIKGEDFRRRIYLGG